MFFQKTVLFKSICLSILIVTFSKFTDSSLQGEEVSRWANAIGDDLWKLGQEVTKFMEIKQKYDFLNAKVHEENPMILLEEIKGNILRMMDRKMDAIRCIQQKAEEAAERFQFNASLPYKYYSSKYSNIYGANATKLPKSLKKNRAMYKTMKLNNDTHFYNLAVNTTHSSVHVPTNVYDLEAAAAEAIQWSEELDEVFVQNYNSDPALSWQYFGSSSGIMRHYPAMPWKNRYKDLFDCRIRTWFIEAATCTKDVIILMDNSGSMWGMGKHIASLTAYSILRTFSNNDYVNVLNYSVSTDYIVPCFKDKLVQATEENIEVFKEAIRKLEPSGKTQLDQALEIAFDLLHNYRLQRNCTEEHDTTCNQAIMIITDGVNRNLSDVIIKYNFLNNGSNIPVRLFTYLIGKEVTNVEEIKWISCENRGYYTHVQTLEQVTASVLQYIYVVARPLVLQGEDHPVSWTHAYADLTYDDATDTTLNVPYRLLTSAAIPCFDVKINKMNDTRTADLLGVAGTDVPIDEFSKLTMPYKIGVNAYAYMVSNNGYLLMHPDLRPVVNFFFIVAVKDRKIQFLTTAATNRKLQLQVGTEIFQKFEGILKDNFNSIDLTEVEQLDIELPPRVISDVLLDLRNSLVNGIEGSKHGVKMKYHYDDNKRISEEPYDYYFSPLNNTPFSIAIGIPSRYGNYSLDVGDEIRRNRHTGEKLTSFFKGNWKVHPSWVYCKYHYLEGHEFETPEEELLHFLGKMYNRDFKWERQYEPKEDEDITTVECGRKTLGDDDYYCDKQLVQRLIFDARNTHDFFKDKWTFQSDHEQLLFEKYNVSLRFVATMSGLTRWDYIFQDDQNNQQFGDKHPRAINENWYKSAVLQHQYDTESFVYSVPFNNSDVEDIKVTGSYAIFPSDAGFEAPGSVVGFQFSQSKLKSKVEEVSTRLSNQCAGCRSCEGALDCYVVDSSGYIIVSENNEDTGRFIGEIEGDILESMIEEKIFKRKVLYDLQALCLWTDEPKNSSSCMLLTPIDYVQMTLKWFYWRAFYILMETSFYNVFDPLFTLAQNIIVQDNSIDQNVTSNQNSTVTQDAASGQDAAVLDDDEDEGEEDEDEKSKYFPCEKRTELYMLQQFLIIHDSFHGEISREGRRSYYVKRIPNSNLIFVAIESVPNVEKPVYTTEPKKFSKAPVWDTNLMNETLLPCQKLYLGSLPRRRLTGCYNEHPLEHEIKACGKSTALQMNIVLMLLSISLRKLCT